MRDFRLNPTAATRWLKESEDLLVRIADGLARDEQRIARSREMLVGSYDVIRHVDRRLRPAAD
jgi:hypothetical protein